MVLCHLCRKNYMLKKFQQAEENKLRKYCEKNNISLCILESLNEIIEQFLGFDSENKYLRGVDLYSVLNMLDFVADWFGIQLCYNIYTRDIIEEFSKQEILNYFKKYEEFPINTVKCMIDNDALGNTLNQYFIDCPYGPQYTVITYEYLGVLIESLVDDIKELSGIV